VCTIVVVLAVVAAQAQQGSDDDAIAAAKREQQRAFGKRLKEHRHSYTSPWAIVLVLLAILMLIACCVCACVRATGESYRGPEYYQYGKVGYEAHTAAEEAKEAGLDDRARFSAPRQRPQFDSKE
jgi:hypothetical protein